MGAGVFPSSPPHTPTIIISIIIMPGFISDAQAKALSQEAEASIWSNDGQSANAVQGSKEQQFTIQPHPAVCDPIITPNRLANLLLTENQRSQRFEAIGRLLGQCWHSSSPCHGPANPEPGDFEQFRATSCELHIALRSRLRSDNVAAAQSREELQKRQAELNNLN